LGLFRMLEDWTAREKGPPSVGRMWLDQFRFLRPAEHPIAIHFLQNINAINNPSAIRRLAAPFERPCLIELLQYDNYMA
jgi:hypothetical protein